jgi:hypothetical protein
MKALYLALLAGKEYRSAINSSTASIRSGVEFTPGLFSITGRINSIDIDCFQPLD